MKTSFKFITIVIALILLGAGTYEYVQSQTPAPPICIEDAKASASIDFSAQNYSGKNNATISVLINCPGGGKFKINEFSLSFIFIGSNTNQMSENYSNTNIKYNSMYPFENQDLNYSRIPLNATVVCFCLSFSYKHPERNITWNFDSPGNYSSKKLPTGYYAFFRLGMAGYNFVMNQSQLRSFLTVQYPYVYISTSNNENPSILEYHNRYQNEKTSHDLYSLAENFFLHRLNWQKAYIRRHL